MIDEKYIEKQLKKFKPKPDQNWQQDTYSNLMNFVTNSQTDRIRNRYLFKLFNINIMNLKTKAIIISTIVGCTLLGSAGTVYASDAAAPGDFLYPIDKATEQVRRALTFNNTKKAELEMDILNERIEELNELSISGDKEGVSEAIKEVEEQQIRLQERLREMEQLRSQNKLKTEEHQRIMEQVQNELKNNIEQMNKIQEQLRINSDNSNIDNLQKTQQEYSNQIQNQIQTFENNTGGQIQEIEKFSGKDSHIQNRIGPSDDQSPNQGSDSNNSNIDGSTGDSGSQNEYNNQNRDNNQKGNN